MLDNIDQSHDIEARMKIGLRQRAGTNGKTALLRSATERDRRFYPRSGIRKTQCLLNQNAAASANIEQFALGFVCAHNSEDFPGLQCALAARVLVARISH